MDCFDRSFLTDVKAHRRILHPLKPALSTPHRDEQNGPAMAAIIRATAEPARVPRGIALSTLKLQAIAQTLQVPPIGRWENLKDPSSIPGNKMQLKALLSQSNLTVVVELDVTTDVQAMLDGTKNYGWLIKKMRKGFPGHLSDRSGEELIV